MRAVGLYRYLPIAHPESLVDVELPKPEAAGRDLLVKVEAVSVNPVDTKVRAPKDKVETAPRVLGWDAAGVVEAAGPECEFFKPGDTVYYAGSIARAGCDSEWHLVDERIAGRKPSSLSFDAAAALPLTTITAWEALFDRLGVSREGSDEGKSLLIVGGAGGVGSIAIQLAKRIARLNVIATASRNESRAWCLELGADATVDHFGDIPAQLRSLGTPEVDYALCFNDTDLHFPALAEAIAPQGRICTIVETREPIHFNLLKTKSATISWEFMFTRPVFGTPDMIEQHRLLNAAAALVDAGTLRTTLREVLGPVNAANLKRAHALLEAHHVTGKLVLSGFGA